MQKATEDDSVYGANSEGDNDDEELVRTPVSSQHPSEDENED